MIGPGPRTASAASPDDNGLAIRATPRPTPTRRNGMPPDAWAARKTGGMPFDGLFISRGPRAHVVGLILRPAVAQYKKRDDQADEDQPQDHEIPEAHDIGPFLKWHDTPSDNPRRQEGKSLLIFADISTGPGFQLQASARKKNDFPFQACSSRLAMLRKVGRVFLNIKEKQRCGTFLAAGE